MGRRQEDMAGRRFGGLTVAEPTGERRNGYVVWRCVCDCGGEALAPSRHLRNGWAVDCGCGCGQAQSRDLTGERFGRLLVLGPEAGAAGEGRGTAWRCRCDCGALVTADARQLAGGHRKSCGCLRRPAPKDWIGRRFGNLTVTGYDGKRGGCHYWRCQCQCGRETVASQSNLKNGHTRSCGCLADPTATRHFVEGTCIESIRSRRVSASNRSGVRGVYRNRRTGRWAAQITFQGRTRYLGSFDSLEEAAAARAEAEGVFDEFLERHGAAGQADAGRAPARMRYGRAPGEAAQGDAVSDTAPASGNGGTRYGDTLADAVPIRTGRGIRRRDAAADATPASRNGIGTGDRDAVAAGLLPAASGGGTHG